MTKIFFILHPYDLTTSLSERPTYLNLLYNYCTETNCDQQEIIKSDDITKKARKKENCSLIS